MEKEKLYYIWDIERNAWWRQNRHGYSSSIITAGLFDKETTEEIVKPYLEIKEAIAIPYISVSTNFEELHKFSGTVRKIVVDNK